MEKNYLGQVNEERLETLERMKNMACDTAVEEIRRVLARTEKNSVINNTENYLKVLSLDPLLHNALAYNIMTGRVDVRKKLWWNRQAGAMTDSDENNLYTYFEVNYGLTNEVKMRKALDIAARDNSYHPVRDFLNGLQWDGKERIRYLLQKYLGSDASELTYQCMLHFMLGAIKRVYEPGCKFEEMLCLVGSQGAGKSTFFRFLACNDDWFQDSLDKLGDSHVYEKLSGHWIIEMSEMTGVISAKNNEELKAFLSRQKESYRIPYNKYSQDWPRQCVFVGTTNSRQFLPFDRSGFRRFLPIEVDPEKAEKHILENEKEARSEIKQAWAEAMVIYRSGEYSMLFPSEIQNELENHRKRFMQEDSVADRIQSWLDEYKGNYVCTRMLWVEALGRSESELDKQYHFRELNDIMHHSVTGWKPGGYHRIPGYGIQRSYVREGVNEEDTDFRPLTKAEQMELPFK